MKNVYYGWWVLAGLFLIYAASNGIVLNTLPIFYPELIKEFAWNGVVCFAVGPPPYQVIMRNYPRSDSLAR